MTIKSEAEWGARASAFLKHKLQECEVTYEELAKHYDWLRGVAEVNFTDARGVSRFPTAAVDARAVEAGAATAWFRQWGDGRIPFADPSREIVVAFVYVDDSGEVRWARRVFG